MDYSKLSDVALQQIASGKPVDYAKLPDEDLRLITGEPEPPSPGPTLQAPTTYVPPAERGYEPGAGVKPATTSRGAFEDVVGRGFRENITSQVFEGATKLATGREAPNFANPEATTGNAALDIAAQAPGMIADPAALGIAKGVSKGLKYFKPFQAADELALAVQEQRVAREFGEAGADAAFKSAVRQYAINKVQRYSAIGAAEFGAYGAASEAAKQFKEQDLDLGSLVSRTFQDAGLGAVLGPAVGLPFTKVFGDAPTRRAIEIVNNKPISIKAAQGPNAIERAMQQKEDALFAQRAKLQERLEEVRGKANEKNATIYSKHQERLQTKLGEVESSIQTLRSERGKLPATRDSMAAEASPLTQEARQIKEQLSRGTRSIAENEKAALAVEREKLVAEQARLNARRSSVEQRAKDAPNAVYASSTRKASSIEREIKEATAQRDAILKLSKNGMSDKGLRAYERVNALIQKLESQKEVAIKQIGSDRLANANTAIGREAKAVEAKTSSVNARLAEVEQALSSGEMRLTSKEQKALLTRKKQLTSNIASVKQDATAFHYKKTEQINKRLAALQEQREALLQAPVNTVEPKAIGAISERMTAIDAEIAAVQAEKKTSMQAFKDAINEREPITYGDVYAKQKFVERAFNVAEKEVQRLVEKGYVPENRKAHIVAHALQEMITQRGFALHKGNTIIQGLNQIMLPLDVLSRVDGKHGTMAGRVVMDIMMGSANKTHLFSSIMSKFTPALEALSKRGLSNHEITHHLETVIKDVEGNIVAPNLLLETYPELATLRQALDEVHAMSGATDYRAGYVPYRRKTSQGLQMGKANPDLVESPTFNEARNQQQLLPGYHETDAFELLRRYSNEVATHVAFKDTLPQVFNETQKLLAVGDSQAANYLARYASRSMEIGGTRQIADKFADIVMKNNKADLDVILQQVDNPDGLLRDIWNATSQVMYKSLVIAKLPTQLLQFLQPELIGSAEVGHANIRKAYNRMAKDKAFREFVFSKQNILGTVDASNLEEAGIRMIKNKYVRGVEKALTLPLQPAQFTFQLGERLNRPTMFAAGYLQFEEALANNAVKDVVSTLTAAERGTVLHALETKGEEAAKEMYGVIRSYRTNLCYTLANKPEIFTHGLGKLIPFTTWTSNSISRIVQDAARGDATTLVKRVMIPVIGKGIFSALTGYDINANPYTLESAASGLAASPAPQITQPASKFAQTMYRTDSYAAAYKAAAKEALKYTPAGPAMDMLKKAQENREGGEILGFKKDPETRWQMRALPKIFRDLFR